MAIGCRGFPPHVTVKHKKEGRQVLSWYPMSVIPFDDLDDFFEYENRNRKAADARVQDWQKALGPGDYFVRDPGLGFNIYGEILELDEPYTGPMEHYRFCRAYSVACPGGELGDIHISQIGKRLAREEFEVAKRRGWR